MKISTNIKKEEKFLDLVRQGKFTIYKNGKIYSNSKNKFIGSKSPDGYLKVRFFDKESGKEKSVMSHRIVWQYFNGPFPKDKPYINHKDFDRTNNNLSNLEPVSVYENYLHAKENGRANTSNNGKHAKIGVKSINGIFSEEQILSIRNRYSKSEITAKALAKEYNCNPNTITNILRNKTYKDVDQINCDNVNNSYINIDKEIIFINAVNRGDYIVSENGLVYSNKVNRYLNNTHNSGYPQITMQLNGKTISMFVHRLVYILYKGNLPEGKPYINHIDGNPSNNHINNLEAVNHVGNMTHAKETQLFKPLYERNGEQLALRNRGQNHHLSKLSDTEAQTIFNLYNNSDITIKKLAQNYNVSLGVIQRILNKKSYNVVDT